MQKRIPAKTVIEKTIMIIVMFDDDDDDDDEDGDDDYKSQVTI